MSQTPPIRKLPILQRDHRSVMGKILHTSKKPDRLNQSVAASTSASTCTPTASHLHRALGEIDDRPR